MSHEITARAFGRVALAAGLLAAAGVACAASGSVLSGATIASQGNGAGVPACASCHGAKGEGNAAAGFPRLAALPAGYLAEQLDAFASGARANPVMQPFVKGLTAPQRQAVAAYYGGLADPLPQLAAPPDDSATPAQTGAWLATRGRWLDGLPACAQCHGPNGSGVGAHFPPLAGQPEAYLVAQLNAWKAGSRPPGPLGLMHAVAAKLSDTDIKAVAQYYAALPEQLHAAPRRKGAKQ